MRGTCWSSKDCVRVFREGVNLCWPRLGPSSFRLISRHERVPLCNKKRALRAWLPGVAAAACCVSQSVLRAARVSETLSAWTVATPGRETQSAMFFRVMPIATRGCWQSWLRPFVGHAVWVSGVLLVSCVIGRFQLLFCSHVQTCTRAGNGKRWSLITAWWLQLPLLLLLPLRQLRR